MCFVDWSSIHLQDRDFLFHQWFLALLNNGENLGLGFVAVCFGLKQFFGSRFAIDRDWSASIGMFNTCLAEGFG